MPELMEMLGQFLWLAFVDGLFLLLLFAAVLLPLFFIRKAAFAVMKRNFVGYFSNPTGYVFLCLFVILTSLGAFFPHEFFSSNLANLAQLNEWIPVILLLFIPTITMSIWAEERRQGTDELLLTLPANDFDIVFGKYLAAAAIFTVSLLFSQLSSYAVLVSLTLGNIDSGLLFTTYLGYWFMGLAMLSIGMVASFLTNNLTVGFILGALLNGPLVLAKTADIVIARTSVASTVSRWSFASQFDDFGRGVISLASVAYFLLIVALGIYLSIVLISKRHWFNSSEGQSRWRVLGYSLVSVVSGFALITYLLYAWDDGTTASSDDVFARVTIASVWGILGGLAIGLASVSLVSVFNGFSKPEWIRRNMFDQYVVRAISLIALVFGATYLLSNWDFIRQDMTRGKVSSLSPQTEKLVRTLDNQYPIVIDAYLSADMPERYAKTRYDLLALLKEFGSLAGKGIQVNIHDGLERASQEARDAEAQYGIVPRPVTLLSRGAIREEQLILGVGFRCGLEKVTVPFLDYGVPVEYELVRSITTVAKGEKERRKKVFVVNTDAQITGGFSMNMMSPQQIPEQAILAELRKQYTVEAVDLTEPFPIDRVKEGDVMLVVQPSSLGPQQMSNLVDAVKKGVPAAIFEDPTPAVMGHVPGTAEPKRGGGMFGQPPQPKGDIRLLWKAIGVSALGDKPGGIGEPTVDLVWQKYNPYRKLEIRGIGPELVFVRPEQPTDLDDGKPAFNPDSPMVATLEEILFPYPGGVVQQSEMPPGLKFTELVRTGDILAGAINSREYMDSRMDPSKSLSQAEPSGKPYVIAAEVRGKSEEKDEAKDDKSQDKQGEAPKERPIHVVYVADIDCIHSQFVEMRANPNNELFGDITFNFDNVSFLLNVIDTLSGDDRFLEIRTRKFKHPTLRAVEMQAEKAREEMDDNIVRIRREFEEKTKETEAERDEALKKFRDEVTKLQERQRKGEQIDYNRLRSLIEERGIQEQVWTQRVETARKNAEQDMMRKINQIELDNELRVQQIQTWFKAWAILLPPIPPLLLGLVVFARRRVREREGISKERMR